MIDCRPETLDSLRTRAVLRGDMPRRRLEVSHKDYGHVANISTSSGRISFRPLAWNARWASVPLSGAGLRVDVKLPVTTPFLDILGVIAARIDAAEAYVSDRAQAARSDP